MLVTHWNDAGQEGAEHAIVASKWKRHFEHLTRRDARSPALQHIWESYRWYSWTATAEGDAFYAAGRDGAPRIGGAITACPEDGGDWPIDRRYSARLQKFANRHLGLTDSATAP